MSSNLLTGLICVGSALLLMQSSGRTSLLPGLSVGPRGYQTVDNPGTQSYAYKSIEITGSPQDIQEIVSALQIIETQPYAQRLVFGSVNQIVGKQSIYMEHGKAFGFQVTGTNQIVVETGRPIANLAATIVHESDHAANPGKSHRDIYRNQRLFAAAVGADLSEIQNPDSPYYRGSD